MAANAYQFSLRGACAREEVVGVRDEGRPAQGPTGTIIARGVGTLSYPALSRVRACAREEEVAVRDGGTATGPRGDRVATGEGGYRG